MERRPVSQCPDPETNPSHKIPERLLLAAILDNAVQDLRGFGVHRNSQTASQAREWIFDSADKQPFSFRWICENLDLDIEFTRKFIRKKYR